MLSGKFLKTTLNTYIIEVLWPPFFNSLSDRFQIVLKKVLEIVIFHNNEKVVSQSVLGCLIALVVEDGLFRDHQKHFSVIKST